MKFLNILVLATFLFVGCSKDDTPEPVNSEEVITTLRVSLVEETTSSIAAPPITLEYIDLDGDGPNEPVITVSKNLTAGVTYAGSISLLNETESPAENIMVEVEEESDEHQFFYTAGGGLDVTTTYKDFDDNNNPLGGEFTLTGVASSGTLTFTLRHELTKPNTGLGDAGGETDITATFNIVIE